MLSSRFICTERRLLVGCTESSFSEECLVKYLRCSVRSAMSLVVFLDVFQPLLEVKPNIGNTSSSSNTFFAFENQQLILSSTIEVLEQNQRIHAFALFHFDNVLQAIINNNLLLRVVGFLEHEFDHHTIHYLHSFKDTPRLLQPIRRHPL